MHPPTAIRSCDLDQIAALRDSYRRELNCQIVHDSIHSRPGWTREYIFESAQSSIGYGSIAVDGPWRDRPTIYEFYVEPSYRNRAFDIFSDFRIVGGAKAIETQTNNRLLTTMLHTLARKIRGEAILFEDAFETNFQPARACVRLAVPEDKEALRRRELDENAVWVVTLSGDVVGGGGVLQHYNRPYGDLFMDIARPFRRNGLGAYLIQELKVVCRGLGAIPAARCAINNVPSRRTLQKAGFVPCGNIVAGEL
jgi:GNAT superfamily N-acetyltransferase